MNHNSDKNFTVLGMGHSGHALAADLALQGCKVTFASLLRPRNERKCDQFNGINVTQDHESFYVPLHKVTNNIADALADSDVIMLAVPAYNQMKLAELIIPHLRHGQFVYLSSYFGALKFAKLLKDKKSDAQVTIIEAITAIHAARSTQLGQVHILGQKDFVPIAAYPAHKIDSFFSYVSSVLPNLLPLENVLESALNNIGPILHVPMMLLNAGRIENTQGKGWNLYKDGITHAVENLITDLDAERKTIANALNLTCYSIKELMMGVYYKSKSEDYDCLWDWLRHSPIHATDVIGTPDSINHRYLTEGISCGLSPLSSIAKTLGIVTPTINATIALAFSILDSSLFPDAVSIDDFSDDWFGLNLMYNIAS